MWWAGECVHGQESVAVLLNARRAIEHVACGTTTNEIEAKKLGANLQPRCGRRERHTHMHASCHAHFSELWQRAELNRPRVCRGCALVTTRAQGMQLPNVRAMVQGARMVICLQTGCFLFGERSSTRSSSLQKPDPACPRPAWWNGWRAVCTRQLLWAIFRPGGACAPLLQKGGWWQ